MIGSNMKEHGLSVTELSKEIKKLVQKMIDDNETKIQKIDRVRYLDSKIKKLKDSTHRFKIVK